VPARRVHPRRSKVGVRVDVVRPAPGRRRPTVLQELCGALWPGAVLCATGTVVHGGSGLQTVGSRLRHDCTLGL
jgi:hypothetical protein